MYTLLYNIYIYCPYPCVLHTGDINVDILYINICFHLIMSFLLPNPYTIHQDHIGYIPLSLTHTLSITHAPTYTHTLSLSFPFSLTQTLSLLSLSLSHTLSLFHIHTLSLSHIHRHILSPPSISYTHTLSHTLSLTHSLSHILSLTHNLSLSLSHTHSLTHTLTLCLFFYLSSL